MKWLRRIGLLFVALIAAFTAVLSAASAWVFYRDDRVPSKLPMVGRIVFDLPEGRTEGTAFLVDECGVLTNFHVVFGPWTVTVLRPPSQAFTGTFTLTEVGAPGGHPSAKAIPVIWGNYVGADRQIRRADQDWTYLILENCLGRRHGYLGLSGAGVDAMLDDGDSFSAAGYSTGRQMIDPDCHLAGSPETRRRRGLGHDCVMMAGDSGSPIMKRNSYVVAALGSGYLVGNGGAPCLTDRLGSLLAFAPVCSNIAVGITRDLIDKIAEAGAAARIQRMLHLLDYDVGELGNIEDPRFVAAIQRFRRDLKLPETFSNCMLEKVLKQHLPVG